jgi:CubicO group peptidase (beta-lactamase class C family)
VSTPKRWRPFILLLAVAFASGSCVMGRAPNTRTPSQPAPFVAVSPAPSQTPSDAEKTIWPTEAWPISSPAEQDMDASKLMKMMAFLDENNVAVDSVVVVRHGHIVWEEYRNDYSDKTPHHLQSVTKSVTSMLIGIALREGLIENVDQRMLSFFPDHDIANVDARKERITLEHLLTMSEGMDWHELDFPYNDRRNTLGQMWTSHDAVQHVLDTPMAREPGAAWAYNSGTSILLGGIIEQVTGEDLLSFAREHLFDPLGISYVYWEKTRGNHYHTDGGLYLRPRDMARLGYLMLRGGTWDGQEILSPDWVASSSTAQKDTGNGYGYGYQWWTLSGDTVYAANGHYEQKIYVIPKADMVVVFTANIADEDPHVTDALLHRFILASCVDLASDPTVETYSDFGVRFDYPAGALAIALPIPGRDTVSDASGMFVVIDDYYPRRFITTMWDSAQADTGTTLEERLGTLVASVGEQPGVDLPQVNIWETSEQSGHTMIFGDLALTSDGAQSVGSLGAWICNQTQRLHVFIAATDGPAQTEQVRATFDELLAGFHCHGGRAPAQ